MVVAIKPAALDVADQGRFYPQLTQVKHRARLYHLMATAEEAEGRLPFPDPQLSFAEMAELARCDCPAGRRLADLLASVVRPPEPPPKRRSGGRKKAGNSSAGA